MTSTTFRTTAALLITLKFEQPSLLDHLYFQLTSSLPESPLTIPQDTDLILPLLHLQTHFLPFHYIPLKHRPSLQLTHLTYQLPHQQKAEQIVPRGLRSRRVSKMMMTTVLTMVTLCLDTHNNIDIINTTIVSKTMFSTQRIVYRLHPRPKTPQNQPWILLPST
jgi:hypothetical protein